MPKRVISPASPLSARLQLAPRRHSRSVLDGAWWPRSWDPAAELPGLVVALAARYGRIWHMMLNDGTWDGRFKRLQVGPVVVRMGWFASLDGALAIAITERGDQIDLLIVPPSASSATAERAMTAAADPRNLMHAAEILAAEPTSSQGAANGRDPQEVWDNEGGSVVPQ